MTELACRWVQDRLPDRARDALDIADAARLDQHLATCDDCRAESVVVNALAVPVVVPAEVEAKVLGAIRANVRSAVTNGFGIRHYGMAATIAFALLTGSIFWLQSGHGPPVGRTEPGATTMLALPDSDPLLQEAGLQSLSEDELRTLLEELES